MLSVVMCDNEGWETQYKVDAEVLPSDIMRLATRAMRPAPNIPPRDSTLNWDILNEGHERVQEVMTSFTVLPQKMFPHFIAR